MILRHFTCAGLVLGVLSTTAQSWVAAGVPCYTVEMSGVHVDTIGDALYYSGESSANGDSGFDDQVISVYKSGVWDTLGLFLGRPKCIVRWHDTLVAAGDFFSVNGDTNMRYIACYDSAGWYPYGAFTVSGIEDLKIIDGELYAIGSFAEADGHYCNGIAKRVGAEWVNVGTMDVYTNNIVVDLLEWHDTLYATGVLRFSGGLPRDIAWFDGAEWHPLGPGITGGFSAGRSLAVYQDELYVGGSIDIQAGNAGHGIMRWNGSQFLPVGSGLQGSCGTYNCPAGAIDLKVHDGLLFVSGAFKYAGLLPTEHMATWDGVQWCTMPGVLRGPVNAFDFYHDTLFAAPFLEAEGVYVNSAAKFIGTSYFGACSGPLAVVEPGPAPQALQAWWSTARTLNIDGLQCGKQTVQLFDALGRQVYSGQVTCAGDGTSMIMIGEVGACILFIRVLGYPPMRIGPSP